MATERDKLVHRLAFATEHVGIQDLTLDELCRIVPVIEAAWDRIGVPQRDDNNIITFAACRRRRARRVASRKQSSGNE